MKQQQQQQKQQTEEKKKEKRKGKARESTESKLSKNCCFSIQTHVRYGQFIVLFGSLRVSSTSSFVFHFYRVESRRVREKQAKSRNQEVRVVVVVVPWR